VGHLVGGGPGDKGTGWRKCKGDTRAGVAEDARRKLSDALKADLRRQYDDMVARRGEPSRSSQRQSSERPEFDADALDASARKRRRERRLSMSVVSPPTSPARGTAHARGSTASTSSRQRITQQIRDKLMTLAFTICFQGEGNIAPYSIVSGEDGARGARSGSGLVSGTAHRLTDLVPEYLHRDTQDLPWWDSRVFRILQGSNGVRV